MTSPGQCIAVASGKGGTGKTSFTAGVGAALALSGRRVLCLDCDIGLRNLDLALGLSDRTLMDFSDVAQNRCSLELAAVEHPKIPGLFLLTAPARSAGKGRGSWGVPQRPVPGNSGSAPRLRSPSASGPTGPGPDPDSADRCRSPGTAPAGRIGREPRLHPP